MAVTYSIDSGADAAKFNINATTGVVTFKTAPDFENPSDANHDNVYEVTVKATDPGGASTTQALRVTVTDVIENTNLPPEFTSSGAVNVAENTTSVITVVAVDPDDGGTPPPVDTGGIPLTWNDPRFNATVTNGRATAQRGQNISNKSYAEQSGEPTVTCMGDNVIDTVRVNSRESLRVASSGTYTIQNCYLEAKGTATDHADVIQAYSPGSRGSIILRNTQLRAYSNDATAGLWVADNWTGVIDVKDVVFQGGPYGMRCHPDVGGDNDISMENVYFVGPFGYGPFLFSNVGGHRNNFVKWVNVCNATIVNGKLVPGTPLNKP